MARDLVDNITIASPCTITWDSMVGDDRVRFCGLCEQSVFNISAMTRAEATKLLRANAGGSMCVRIFKRADGAVMTRDCPVGLRKVKEDIRHMRARVCAAVALVLSMVALKPLYGQQSTSVEPVKTPQTCSVTADVDPLDVAKRNTAVPQGDSPTYIEGVGGMQNVRVNNLANLEALIHILGNVGEILGTVTGATMAIAAIRNCRFDTPRARWVMIFSGLLLITGAVLLPLLIDLSFQLMRDANLFS